MGAHTYGWILKKSLGNGSGSDKLQCAAIGAAGKWVNIGSSSGMQSIEYFQGVEFIESTSFERSSQLEASVTASVTGCFVFGEASLEVSASYGQSFARTVSSTVTKSESISLVHDFGPGTVWQWQWSIADVCSANPSLTTNNLALTRGNFEPPCCLPGYALDEGRPHGPCFEGSPCSCSSEVCNAQPTNDGCVEGVGTRGRNLRG